MDFSCVNVEYPKLPVVEKREEFFELLKTHQVVIVKADTGSGKSTQLPKFLFEYFVRENFKDFKIGVTEPRRLAALSIADRLREELKENSLVSTKIRFWEDGKKDAPIKVMTDGILLQEFRRDRYFKEYAAIVIDEAHERSLNIDILLGILKNVCAHRKDLKVIVASATLDAKLFQDFFEASAVLEAEGRTFPVEVKYYYDSETPEDFSGKGDSGLIEEAVDAILELENFERDNLLCFLPTERDIQDLANELKRKLDDRFFDVLPLFGRMSADEQKRVFKTNERTRIVLATNIAETSLTIPGIAYVVDTGMARISRFNAQTRIQGLPVEKISQASARQRTGRAGRVKPGICIRLYAQKDFLNRDEYTEPEIRRSNLANVVLQLRSLGLELEKFPFIQPPPQSAFRGAYKTLFELGALSASNARGVVTPLGREMTKLPMDVSLSAVLLKSQDFGVLHPALIVCAALCIQDPRIIPNEEPEKTRVRLLHKKFGGHKSDFITFISLWNEIANEVDGKSWNKLRKFCNEKSLHFLRCREWIDLFEQFARILNVKFEEKVCPLNSFHRDNLHIALLLGFLSGVAKKDFEKGCFRLVGGRETFTFPGSDLNGKNCEWIFSAEVRETSRTFLNKCAEIKPEWILQIAEPFCTRRWFEPRWNKDRGFVEALEEISFKGMVISRGRRVDYARINPEECAEIFWREAIVNEDIARPFAFMITNQKVIENLQMLETRKRAFGLAPSEDALVDYYTRIAGEVNSIKTLKNYIATHTDQWLKFDEKYWIDLSEQPIVFSHVQKPLTQKMNIPKWGGTLENFRIENKIVPGEMVFNALKERDGISLEFSSDMIPHLTPAKLALSLHLWREWLLDSLIREFPRELKKKLEAKRRTLLENFKTHLKNGIYKAPLLILYELFSELPEIKNYEGALPILNPEKEHHLRLHLTFIHGKESLNFELSPEWGAFLFFKNLYPQIASWNLFYDFENFSWGVRLDDFALMSTEEAEFWNAFFKRIKKHSNGKELAIKERLTRLEHGISAEYSVDLPSKKWALESLKTTAFDERECTLFSGLEYSRNRVLNDFAKLSEKTKSDEERTREILAIACFEVALLDGNSFAFYWNVLREFAQKKQPQIAKKIELLYSKKSSLYKRLKALEFLKENREVSWETFEDDFTKPHKKEMQELFRPFLKSRYLKDFELKNAREKMQELERAQNEHDEEILISLFALLEEFEILRYKRGGDFSEEEIETESLLKLKKTFGKI